MIRIVFKEMNYGAACNVEGGVAKVSLKSFDIEVPALQEWLTKEPSYTERTFVGIETIEESKS